MYFMLIYKTVDNYVERRKPYRDEHLGYAEAAHGRGELFMAGALADPADSAILIFKTRAAPRRGFRAERSLRQGRPDRGVVRSPLDGRYRRLTAHELPITPGIPGAVAGGAAACWGSALKAPVLEDASRKPNSP